MKEINLSMGMVAIVDDEDYKFLMQWKWHACQTNKNKVYARCSCLNIKMHRLITNAPKGIDVDHINGNPLDNRKSNLRFCTKSQNQWNNFKTAKPTSSKYKGVSLCRVSGKWRASIHRFGKTYKLGSFDKEEMAAKTYNEAAINYFGEFARLNNV